MRTVRQLSVKDRKQYCSLWKNVEDNLEHDEWWLPANPLSKKHFFDTDWTIIEGMFEEDELIATSSLFLNPNEYEQSALKLGIDLHTTRVGEIGRCMVRPDFRGNNMMLQLNRILLEEATRLGLDALIATAHPDNAASCSSLEKLGMTKEGFIIKNTYPRNIYCIKLNRVM